MMILVILAMCHVEGSRECVPPPVRCCMTDGCARLGSYARLPEAFMGSGREGCEQGWLRGRCRAATKTCARVGEGCWARGPGPR